jgi:hypothetical protein
MTIEGSSNRVMSEPEKPKIEDLADELAFWNTFREIHRAKGFDVARFYADAAVEVERGLTSPGAREEFAELCRAGCLAQGLAGLIFLLRQSPLFEKFWTEIVGQESNREKATRSLESAIETLKTLYADVIALGNDAENERFTKLGRVPISRVISELRAHIRFINFVRILRSDTETRSPEQLVRYLLTSYVKRMTGEFNDRCVSGVIGEVLGLPDYNEVAQRMWRSRNYERLEKHYAWMVKLMVAMSVVIAHTA